MDLDLWTSRLAACDREYFVAPLNERGAQHFSRFHLACVDFFKTTDKTPEEFLKGRKINHTARLIRLLDDRSTAQRDLIEQPRLFVIRRISGHLRRNGDVWTFLYLAEPIVGFDDAYLIHDSPGKTLSNPQNWVTECIHEEMSRGFAVKLCEDGFGLITKILRDIKSSWKLMLTALETFLEDMKDNAASNPLVKRLFEVAQSKRWNVVVSADLITTKELLHTADVLGPYIALFKMHIDIVADFGPETVSGLQQLAQKHNFLIFEDRKFVDIGNTVQMQYHGGALKISDWAHIVNASVLAGRGIVDAMAQTAKAESSPYQGDRGLLILAEMTTKGSLATGGYTKSSVEIARKYKDFLIGFVATRELSDVATEPAAVGDEDFVILTTGINISTKGDSLGRQYQTPSGAVEWGADFIIAGRGIYAASNPVEAIKLYQKEGCEAYLDRIGPGKSEL